SNDYSSACANSPGLATRLSCSGYLQTYRESSEVISGLLTLPPNMAHAAVATKPSSAVSTSPAGPLESGELQQVGPTVRLGNQYTEIMRPQCEGDYGLRRMEGVLTYQSQHEETMSNFENSVIDKDLESDSIRRSSVETDLDAGSEDDTNGCSNSNSSGSSSSNGLDIGAVSMRHDTSTCALMQMDIENSKLTPLQAVSNLSDSETLPPASSMSSRNHASFGYAQQYPHNFIDPNSHLQSSHAEASQPHPPFTSHYIHAHRSFPPSCQLQDDQMQHQQPSHPVQAYSSSSQPNSHSQPSHHHHLYSLPNHPTTAAYCYNFPRYLV
ncbi:unnamed protein product, partial [Protopolystoma xenopodis]